MPSTEKHGINQAAADKPTTKSTGRHRLHSPPRATLVNADCFDAFKSLPSNSVDAVITDPPYFLDKLGSAWEVDEFKTSSARAAVTSLPVGMKFDPQQGTQFQEFMHRVAIEAYRVLKPGGALVAMSAPRLYHRLGVAVEDAGFEVRDMWSWLYTQNQVKAMSVERFLDTRGLTRRQLARLKTELRSWKTPQIKSCIEPAVFAQKPKLDQHGKPQTFLANWLEHHVGLVDLGTGVGANGDKQSANVITTGPIESALDKSFLVAKPGKSEKGTTSHLSVKPLALMEQFVRLTVPEAGLVLDPFSGSGSTGIAALDCGRNYIGFELNEAYFRQSMQRFTECLIDKEFAWGEPIGATIVGAVGAGT